MDDDLVPGLYSSVYLIKSGMRSKMRAKFYTELAGRYEGDQDWEPLWGAPFPLRASQVSSEQIVTFVLWERHDTENYSTDVAQEGWV